MQIYRISALSDNYIFLLFDAAQRVAAVIDPGDADPVLKKLEELSADLVAIFITHHDRDHVGGNAELLKHFPKAIVYAGVHDRGRIPGQSVELNAGDQVQFSDRTAEVLFVPGHTRGHIAYYFPSVANQPGELFCGDTLFSVGCGRLKEGTPAQMVESLSQIRALPDNTRVWCAHEYTLKNLKFALTIDAENPDLQARFAQVQAANNQPTIPADLGLEKRINPFLRWDQPEIQGAIGKRDEIATFAALREKRNHF
ncbi:hydroxyacylglutathione hydrolase [Leptolyngbya sp. NIES-2104]|uniref:hydroxyacylglutathione hydrolase n=1 Tax=Leptolyngbya sp. NIES-2104 TaxID=1552121 RepID=UPI0006ECB87D|nr:hydroxyacylglutathione hydrolase [Leptolyngbya sp. NIES-2104]GAP97932.1 hydroxyacylglutathione hydrolase [Leptolyngbya sp. NIES-2104]